MLTVGAHVARTTFAARGSSAAIRTNPVISKATISSPSDQKTFKPHGWTPSVGNPLSKFDIRQQTNSLFLLGAKRLCSATQGNQKQLPIGMLLLTAPQKRGFANLSASSSLREPLPGFDHPSGSFVDQFKKPEPKITTLQNGIRLVTQVEHAHNRRWLS